MIGQSGTVMIGQSGPVNDQPGPVNDQPGPVNDQTGPDLQV